MLVGCVDVTVTVVGDVTMDVTVVGEVTVDVWVVVLVTGRGVDVVVTVEVVVNVCV